MTDLPLYLSELEIARAVLGRNCLPEWKAMAIILEREGLPKIDPLMGRRYWPAAKAWFDVYNRVAFIVEDRRVDRHLENWTPLPKRRSRGPAPPQVPPSTER